MVNEKESNVMTVTVTRPYVTFEWYDSLVLQKEPRRIETDYNREGLKNLPFTFLRTSILTV